MPAATESGSIDVSVHYAIDVADNPADTLLAAWCRAALQRADTPPGHSSVAVAVVDAATSESLNSQYRGRQKPTNVLSFPAGDMPSVAGEPRQLGDIVICAPLVVAEAAAQGKSVTAHWCHLVVHGALHLLGFDHDADEDAQVMMTKEVEILDSLGFSDPY
ncbi:MAG: rRNA maturation RNase YbeY [Pseudomonadota bacterium]